MNWTMLSQRPRPAMGPIFRRADVPPRLHGNAEFLFDGEARALAAGFLQLVHDDVQHGPVELLGLRHAQVVDLEPDDRQPGAGEKVNRRPRAGRWETESCAA